MSLQCLSGGCSTFTEWVIPEKLIHQRMGGFYRESPIISRIIVTPLALISATIKVVFFPVICTIGVLALPIIAMIRAVRGEEGVDNCLTAWVFCVIGMIASAALIALFAYYLPLVVSGGICITFLSISITFHVYHLVKEPAP